MPLSFGHQTVLLDEAVELLEAGAGSCIVDGRSAAAATPRRCSRRAPTVIGVDRDPAALAAARDAPAPGRDRFQRAEGASASWSAARPEGLLPVDGVLVDLGVSAPAAGRARAGLHLHERGPAGHADGPDGQTAAELIARPPRRELAARAPGLGEEPFARPIARELKRDLPDDHPGGRRGRSSARVPRKAWPRRIHVATRTFQALRIAVNDELGALDALLAALPRC